MTNKVTINTIASGHGEKALINENFEALQTAIQNTLSRDGTSPNQMNANIDMNGYAILNQLATSGETNFAFIGDWATSTSYSKNNLVYLTVAADATYGGATYICLTDHTSGTFSTDYITSGYWNLFAKRGGSGAGSGDLISTNNLSDVASAATALDNLGVDGSSGAIATGDLADNAVTLAKTAHLTGGSMICMDGSGIPSELAAGTSGYLLQTNGTGSVPTWVENKVDSLLTTRGDIITEGASGSQRLALGASGYVFTSDGTDAVWAANTATVADGAVYRAKLSTTTVSLAGSIGTVVGVDISMNAYAFFPMIHSTTAGSAYAIMTGHSTDAGSADNPRFRFYNPDATNDVSYDVDYRYIQAT